MMALAPAVLAVATSSLLAGAVAVQRRRDDDFATCAFQCPEQWLDDGTCDAACNVEACNWDGKDCFHNASECYTKPDGTDYRGKVSRTKSGLACQTWTEQIPWRHTKDVYTFPEAGLGGHNFCRNPGAEEAGPWCYTLDYPDTRWELCDVGEPVSECDAQSHAAPGGAEAPNAARTVSDAVQPLAVRKPVDGRVKEFELQFYEAELAPSMAGIKIVLLPINGDADLFLSFSTPKPDRPTATWVDETVGVKQFTLPATSDLYCPALPTQPDSEPGAKANPCKLYIGVSGYEEGDFKLFLYNYTIPSAIPGAGGDGLDGAIDSYGYDTNWFDYACAPGCDDLSLGDTVCDPSCNVTACVWDGGDCGYSGGYSFQDTCATGCPTSWIGDGYCDEACFNEACTWDGTDCVKDDVGCSDGCLPTWIDDQECDDLCNNEACGWDGHDCDHGHDSCYHDPRGTDYRGPVAESASGWPCQLWSEQTPNQHTHSHLAFPNAGLGGHNSCRNPGSEEAGPWCYTVGGPRWELCTVPPPSSNCSDSKGVSIFRTQCPVDCGKVLGNGRCDIRCNITSCAYDAGDCGVGLSLDSILEAAAAGGLSFPTSLDEPFGMTTLVGGIVLGIGVGLLILRCVLNARKKEEVKLRGYTIEEMKGMDRADL